MAKIKSKATVIALLMTLGFTSTSVSVFAQGTKFLNSLTTGQNANRQTLDETPKEDFVKVDQKGRLIDDPKAPPRKPVEPKGPITVYEDADDSDLNTDEVAVKEGESLLVATIAVPHMKKAISQVTAYPYPMKPPIKKEKTRLLPEKDKALKNMMLSTGYFSRASLDVPYPPGGWRWQYAFKKAIADSGFALPHTIFEHYSWANRMLPYMRKQCAIYNAFEKTRRDNYLSALEEFTEKRTEYEDSALSRGLTPMAMKRVYPRMKSSVGMHYASNVKNGKWWVVATHRVPGLKYFWLVSTDVEKNKRVVLNEGNAIHIEGGW